MKKINSFTKICLLITSIFLFSCEQPANPPKEPLAPSTISTEQINANIKKSGIAKDVELQTTIQNVSYKLILSASSGTFNASKNERAANNYYSGSFFYKDSYVFINIEDDSTFLKIFVDKVIDEMNKLAVKAKSEIEDTAFIISSNKISTSINSDDYTNAKTNFNDKIEDYLTGLTEDEFPAEEPPVENSPAEEPPVEEPPIENPPENQPEEPPVENPPTEDPFIDDPSVSQSLKESAEYKLLREVGFTHITGVDVPVEAGKYQPKTGEIVELYYNNRGLYPTTYTLNRELSKDGHLVYDGSCYKEIYGLDSMQTWTGDEFICDPKNKTLTHYIPDPDEDPASYQYSYIKINDDGSFVLGGYKNTPNDGSLYEMPVEFNKSENSVDLYMDISFKLANETKQEPEKLPFIVNDTISQALADTAVYKLLREVGFSHITGEDVPVEEGKYQPKTGEITELHYTDQGMNIINFKLNRDLSKDGKLVYDGTNYDVVYGPEEMEKWTGDEFSFDAKNKVLTKHDQYEDKHYYTSIKMQDDGSLVMSKYDKDTVDGVPNNYREISYEFDNTKVSKYDSSNKYEDSIWKDTTSPYYSSAYYTNISFKLAN